MRTLQLPALPSKTLTTMLIVKEEKGNVENFKAILLQMPFFL